MNRMLLVINGAGYAKRAINKAIWLAKLEKAQLDILYVNPQCHQLYPGIPGLCFWMPEREYESIAARLRKRILEEQVLPVFEANGLRPEVIVTSDDQDEKIREISRQNKYNKIFIASPSRYCRQEAKGWPWFKNKLQEIPSGTVCLI